MEGDFGDCCLFGHFVLDDQGSVDLRLPVLVVHAVDNQNIKNFLRRWTKRLRWHTDEVSQT